MSEGGEHERLTGNAGRDPAPSPDQRGDGPGEQPDWDVPKRILAFAVAAVAVWAGIWLGGHAVRYAGPLLVGLGMFLGAAVLLVAGAALTAVGLIGVPARQPPAEGSDPPGQDVARRGLPTDAAAYGGGGLAIATMRSYLEEAEVAASVLTCAGIPAWVDGLHTASWCWHYQFAVHPRGFRVFVPAGRLTEAQAALKPDPTSLLEWFGAEPLETEADVAGYRLLHSARRAALLSFSGFFWPVAFVWACIVLVRARRQHKVAASSAHFVKARRIALFAIVYIGVPVGLVVAGGVAVWIGELL